MRKEVAVTADVDGRAKAHLLKYLRRDVRQENLCFGLWYPSHGSERLTAVVQDLVLPRGDELHLHGNASFEGRYLTRAARLAKRKNAGLVMMHSHPTPGWQDLSPEDTVAERDIVAYQAQSTGLPFVGMTIGRDGYWSARFWTPSADGMRLEWCAKVRTPTRKRYQIDWNPAMTRTYSANPKLQRTVETWGVGVQQSIHQLRIGIVGVGSVGSIVAETLARIGVSEVVLIDPDKIKTHNLDRFLFGTTKYIGEPKVRRVRQQIVEHSTCPGVRVRDIPLGVEHQQVLREALDCDLVMSCVDRPVPRDVLNYLAIAHAIPVIEAGVAVEVNPNGGAFESARWRSYLIIPGSACLRCNGQYSSSDVVAELDGSLDDPSYIQNLPADARPQNQNVFPFSLGCAAMQVNLMIRYILASTWWPSVQRQEYRIIAAETRRTKTECRPHCVFRTRIGMGSREMPSYLKKARRMSTETAWSRLQLRIRRLFEK